MATAEVTGSTALVRAINEQRGCPFMLPATFEGEGACPVNEMTPDARKQEYYFLLDHALPKVIGIVRELREGFQDGLVKRNEAGVIVSSVQDMEARVEPLVEAGDFFEASYWTHDAIYTTIDVATTEWLARASIDSPDYQRLNSLVDDQRKQAYGESAVQKRISSAANQTVLISCGFQRMTERLFPASVGRPITSPEMAEAHDANLKLAVPLTRLHLTETRYIRKELGAEALPGGRVEVYTNEDYFAFENGRLGFKDMRLAESMVSYPGDFPDARIGCPGVEYIPEIWQWAGQLSAAHAFPALGK